MDYKPYLDVGVVSSIGVQSFPVGMTNTPTAVVRADSSRLHLGEFPRRLLAPQAPRPSRHRRRAAVSPLVINLKYNCYRSTPNIGDEPQFQPRPLRQRGYLWRTKFGKVEVSESPDSSQMETVWGI